MSPRTRAWRGLAAASLSTLLAAGALYAAHLASGRELLGPDRAGAAVAIAAGVAALLLLAAGLVAARARWWAWPLALVGWWLGVETFVSPHLAELLNLRNYYFVLDVDHIPMEGNSDNVRDAREASAFMPEGLNLVFLGDSFTFGHGLELEETFPQVVEELLGPVYPVPVRAANFGWTSSSPLLSWRRLESIGEKYSPDVVVMCVDMTDFQDDIKYANMLEGRGVYGVYDRIPLTLKLLSRVRPSLFRRWWSWTNDNMPAQRFFPAEQPLEESRPFLGRIVDSIGRIDAWCRERGVLFVVVVLPRHFQYSDRESPKSWEASRYTVLGPYCLEPFRFFDELAAEVDYPVHSLLPAFQETEVFPTCFEDDPHWNAAGARVAGEEIARILRQEIDRAGILAGG